MMELIRTNDAVVLSFAKSLMDDAGIVCFIADYHTSLLEGSMGFLQRRLMVDNDKMNEAKQILIDAGLESELRD